MEQMIQCFRAEGEFTFLIHFRFGFAQEPERQYGDFLTTCPEGRDFQFEGIQAVVEIFPEFTCLDLLAQIPVGRRDDSDIDGNGLDRADRVEALLYSPTAS